MSLQMFLTEQASHHKTCDTDLQRARAVTISSIRRLRLLTEPRLTASLPTTMLVQKASMTLFTLRLTRPPGGLNAQHLTPAGWTWDQGQVGVVGCMGTVKEMAPQVRTSKLTG